MTISTPIVEVSQIQIRRGPADDLPGAPTIGNPTTPTTPLNVGELAFTTDTGQVFIGPDLQNTGGSTFLRAFFPYQNIEVLTENSRTFLLNLFDYYYRDVQTGFYDSLPLNNTSNTGDWQTLLVNCGDGQIPAIISATANLACAQINYYLYDTGTVVRTGQMKCVYIGGSAQPILEDEFSTYGRTDVGSSIDPTVIYGSIQFRAVPIAAGSGQNVVIEYQNIGASNPVMFFRLERGASQGGNTICQSNSEIQQNPNGVQIFNFQIGNTPVLMDTWGVSTIDGGIGSYYVLANTNSPGSGSQVSSLTIGTDGVGANYENNAIYSSAGSLAPNILDYDVACTSGIVTLSANTITSGAVATVTLVKFPVYLVQS